MKEDVRFNVKLVTKLQVSPSITNNDHENDDILDI